MNTLTKNMTRMGLLLAGVAIAGTGLVALTNTFTKDQIEENEYQATLRKLNELVPVSQRSNDMVKDTIHVTAPNMLGSKKPLKVYRARFQDMPVVAVFEVVAPDGYSGDIKMLVAIHFDGIVAGARVVDHKETAGLGDYIEEQRSNWIFDFDNRSLSNPTKRGWAVKKDGGEFDQVTGATITPRAVVKAIHKALQYFAAYRDEIFNLPSGSEVTHNDSL